MSANSGVRSSYLSQSELAMTFGLARRDKADEHVWLHFKGEPYNELPAISSGPLASAASFIR
jgi:hypothetical protein